jgi:hypothetical protein
MKHENETFINAAIGEGEHRRTREFTTTQWGLMGKDKGGWKPTAPTELAKPDGPDQKTADEVELVNARNEYEALFERKAHPSTKLATLKSQIAAELERQNKEGDGTDTGTGTPSKPSVPSTPPAAPSVTPPADKPPVPNAGQVNTDASPNADPANVAKTDTTQAPSVPAV